MTRGIYWQLGRFRVLDYLNRSTSRAFHRARRGFVLRGAWITYGNSASGEIS